MHTVSILRRQEAEAPSGGAAAQTTTASVRKPRVLLIAEAANPVLTSAALVAWSCSRAIMEVCDVHLVTELRNREDILKAGVKEENVTFINARRTQHAAWRIATWLRGGKDLGWTTYAAFTALAYPFFERGIWKTFKKRLKQGEFDLVHRVHPLSPMTPSLLAKKLDGIGVPFVVGPLNGGVPWPKEFSHLRAKEKEWMGRFRNLPKLLPGYRNTRKHARAIIVAARTVWNDTPEEYRDKCVFIPENAIDPARFPVIPRPARSGPLKISFVGRLVPLKGVDMLVRAVAPLVRDGRVTLNVIGDGPERESLRELAAQLGTAEGVRLDGWVAHENLSGVLAESDVFAFPSVREFGGGVVLEAMALGVVPVVLDWGGPPELVPAECGFTVPMGTPESIVMALRSRFEKLCAEPASLDELSKNAQLHVRRHFTWQAKAKQVLEVYNWVLGRREEKPHWGMPVKFDAEP
jgi:glycosyltransferase involved in cell wall biosynthesis